VAPSGCVEADDRGGLHQPEVLAERHAEGVPRKPGEQVPAQPLAFGIGGAEWLRGHLFTGFPWNTLGMALGQNLWLAEGVPRKPGEQVPAQPLGATDAEGERGDAGGPRRSWSRPTSSPT
jgi:hypothetical protein